jgi:hypothetical protein
VAATEVGVSAAGGGALVVTVAGAGALVGGSPGGGAVAVGARGAGVGVAGFSVSHALRRMLISRSRVRVSRLEDVSMGGRFLRFGLV